MNFKLRLRSVTTRPQIPINYSYPLSAAIYKILSRADAEYSAFLHKSGYGKGFKLFSFSQINCPFRIEGDRLCLLGEELTLAISFYLPNAAENFIKGIFQSASVDIADSRSKGSFVVHAVEAMPDPLLRHQEQDILQLRLTPLSPVVSGLPNEKGYYDFLPPDDERFAHNLLHNWRSKIASCYDEVIASQSLLLITPKVGKTPPKSRLITIKSGTDQETRIRGWMNFELHATAEKRFLDILLKAGAGLYNSQGMGYMESISE